MSTAWLCAGCPSPRQYEGPIAIDQAGFPARFGRACALGGASTSACLPPGEEPDASVVPDAALTNADAGPAVDASSVARDGAETSETGRTDP